MKPTSIYVLRDPRTNEVRYVGKTVKRLNDRLAAHINECASGRSITHRDNWIASLLREGLGPVLEVIEVAYEDWADRERFWIAYYRNINSNLTNHCDGGEGMPGYKRPPEWCAAQSARLIEISARPGARKRLSEQARAAMTPERRAHLSRKTKEYLTPARRKANGMKMREKWTEREYREKTCAAQRASWTPERRVAQAARLKVIRNRMSELRKTSTEAV